LIGTLLHRCRSRGFGILARLIGLFVGVGWQVGVSSVCFAICRAGSILVGLRGLLVLLVANNVAIYEARDVAKGLKVEGKTSEELLKQALQSIK
jgi:hypothetical protein